MKIYLLLNLDVKISTISSTLNKL